MLRAAAAPARAVAAGRLAADDRLAARVDDVTPGAQGRAVGALQPVGIPWGFGAKVGMIWLDDDDLTILVGTGAGDDTITEFGVVVPGADILGRRAESNRGIGDALPGHS